MTLDTPGEVNSLIWELSEPIPVVLRDRYLRRVRAILAGDAIVSPAKVIQACAKAQHELLHAPAVDEKP
jgi:hypothetical protein